MDGVVWILSSVSDDGVVSDVGDSLQQGKPRHIAQLVSKIGEGVSIFVGALLGAFDCDVSLP